jgi:hypothetical protein
MININNLDDALKVITRLRERNELLVKEISLKNQEIIELQEFITSTVDKKINERWDLEVNSQIKELLELKKMLETGKIMDQIRDVAVSTREEAIKKFEEKYEKLKKYAAEKYETLLMEEMVRLNIEKDIMVFINQKIKDAFSQLDNKQVRSLIRNIYRQSLNHINLTVSSDIKEKMCEMNLLQGSLLDDAVSKIELRKKEIKKVVMIEEKE